MSGDAGKGDTYRPVDQKKWDENYERIFTSKKPSQVQDDKTQQVPNDIRL